VQSPSKPLPNPKKRNSFIISLLNAFHAPRERLGTRGFLYDCSRIEFPEEWNAVSRFNSANAEKWLKEVTQRFRVFFLF
jgi:hypothetical protein